MKNNKEEGLPEIAQFQHNPKLIAVLISVIVVIGLSLYFNKKSHPKVEKPVEENYTVPVEPVIVDKVKNEPVSIQEEPEKKPDEKLDAKIVQEVLMLQEKQKELQQRLSAPLMLVNNNSAGNSTTNNSPSGSPASSDANSQFMQQISNQHTDISTATSIGSLNSVIAEGTLIHAVLESASNSDLPGYLRAIVSDPVYSEDGSTILIPVGSRLDGQYKSGMLQGQSRIFGVWTRVITPHGLSVQLGSPGVDSLGVAGMGADEINRHFWQRFGTASLLSIIGIGAANVGVNDDTQENSASAYRTAVANSFSQSANQSLQHDSMIAPTLKTYQGKPIIVFVAKDLHFENSKQKIKSNIQIF
jgi:type IV secretion system protein VirB10